MINNNIVIESSRLTTEVQETQTINITKDNKGYYD